MTIKSERAALLMMDCSVHGGHHLSPHVRTHWSLATEPSSSWLKHRRTLQEWLWIACRCEGIAESPRLRKDGSWTGFRELLLFTALSSLACGLGRTQPQWLPSAFHAVRDRCSLPGRQVRLVWPGSHAVPSIPLRPSQGTRKLEGVMSFIGKAKVVAKKGEGRLGQHPCSVLKQNCQMAFYFLLCLELPPSAKSTWMQVER